MKLKFDNRTLIKDQPKTILTSSVSAAGTTLTVKSNGGFAVADFVLIGKLGDEKAEIKRISAAVTYGTSLTVVAVTFAHDENTQITKLDYDQANFAHTTTATGTKTSLSTGNVDPTEIYTYYEDTTYTTGYGFVRAYDSNGTTYSVYSDAIPYTGYTSKMLRSIRDKVRRLVNEVDQLNSPASNDDIDEEINLAQKEIAHDRLWSFYEKTKSFSSVANQYEYSLASNVFVLFDSKFDTQPLAVIGLARWNILRWDSDTTGDPTHICMWDRKARVYPYPSASANADTLDGDVAVADTTIVVDDASGFKTQGRIIIDSEVISYTGIDDSTDFTGCVRGEEGTTAATHSDGGAVTARDFIYHFQEDPADLSDETDVTAISDPSVLAYKAAAEIAIGILDQEVLHDRLIGKYQQGMVQLRKVDEPKIKVSFGRVKDMNEVIDDKAIWRDPNRYPRNINQ